MAKIRERLAYDQLLSYLESGKLFTRRQTCYHKGHGSQTAVLPGVLDNIHRAVKDRKVNLLPLFKFWKAFDCIPHKKLLLKLRNKNNGEQISKSLLSLRKYNSSDLAITWLHNYLIDRHQTVIDD